MGWYGREDELGVIDRVLQGARQGRSAALVVRGEAGIGKSALLAHAVDAARAEGLRVLRATGTDSESELPFAGLHLLLGRAADRVGELPERQARALGGALGLSDVAAGPEGMVAGLGPASVEASGGDRFLTGLAVLTLLADLAEEQPLLCVVDDAHWLDKASAEALLFAARRLDAEGVVMLFAARDTYAPPFPAQGLDELRVGALSDAAARELLAEHAADLPHHARVRILGEAAGNPLALRELPVAQREGLAHDTTPISGHARVQRTFTDRISGLPQGTRTVLLVAAAEATDDLAVIASAASELGASVTDLDPAERKDLVRVAEGRLVFRHPLIRSAAYRSAPLGDRLAAHRALAHALPCVGNIDRRAWHLAAATTEPDEYVAAVLEETSEHARARGGYTAVAAACERAARLSPDSRDRVRRLALAAHAAAAAGEGPRAADLATRAAPHLTDPLRRAELVKVRAAVAREQGRLETSYTLLGEGAAAVAAVAPGTAAFMLYEAVTAAWLGGPRSAVSELTARLASLELTRSADTAPFVDAALALEQLAADDPKAALPALRDLVSGLGGQHAGLGLRERLSIAAWAFSTGDLEAGHKHFTALEQECRSQGAIGMLPLALMLLARSHTLLGRHRDGHTAASEGLRVAEDIGQLPYVDQIRGVLAHLAAVEGDEERCRELAIRDDVRADPPCLAWGVGALGLLDLGLGRPEAALRRYEELLDGPARHAVRVLYSLPDLIEAAARAGAPDRASAALARYEAWAEATGQAWAEAIALRCRALLAPEERAGELYERAVRLHQGGGLPFERARTGLLYGEWLRRAGRRTEARVPLRGAADAFESVGAGPWAERARAELRATGESRPAATPGGDRFSTLTPQELQVTRLAAAGLSNRDIGAQLFLSPRTVGYHLYNAYPKLGVASRGELARLSERLPG
ncbi:AAA family ATPase [Streptomyces sp. BG9H]|uniref:AAA family ATPase n=1 Tax=Streptomyces anatolicus TaxID=2675858 RepID=A0ABS6YUE8_9ACTN|nr:LuxR family transcriptional regulator [Streptomyces anatolicus]MBW5425039.1 AAA family ATPase [Streptomyces anatolicus]